MAEVNTVTGTVTAVTEATYVAQRLEEAGRSLLAMPRSGYTTAMRCGMPDPIHTAIEAYGWSAETVRVRRPTADEIDNMDEAFAWLRYIPGDRYVLRRIVGARALVHPVTDRHLFPWRRLGDVLGADYRAVQRWHAEAIGLIVAELHRRGFYFPP